jgi:4-hydroxythreonine-4-phosphate dehydrogenase
MGEEKKIKVGISIGDINGIGCEVALKTFQDSRMLEFCTPILFASNKVISQQKQDLGINLNYQAVQSARQSSENKVNVVSAWKDVVELNYGEATQKAGALAIRSLKAAVEALKKDEIDVLVTAPINKANIQSEEFNFPGHTDYLAGQLGGESLMFMVSPELKIGLLTDHLAVKDVPGSIDGELINRKVAIIERSLKMDFGIQRPKIALLGINPHSGDNGVIGKEDDEILRPAIENLSKKGHLVYGPYAADSFFGSGTHRQFDAVLAAYHDQGLIPFKTLSFGKGVNFTAGLSHVRTSPDHGTAYEIAGKGEADESSFKEAVFSALEIFKKREEFKALTQNPLKAQKMRK